MVCTISRFCWHHTRFNNIVEGSCRWNLSSANLYSNQMYINFNSIIFIYKTLQLLLNRVTFSPRPQRKVETQKFPGAALEDGYGAWNPPPPPSRQVFSKLFYPCQPIVFPVSKTLGELKERLRYYVRKNVYTQSPPQSIYCSPS